MKITQFAPQRKYVEIVCDNRTYHIGEDWATAEYDLDANRSMVIQKSFARKSGYRIVIGSDEEFLRLFNELEFVRAVNKGHEILENGYISL